MSLSVFMRCRPILCCWSMWRFYQDLLMSLTISLSLFPPPSLSFSFSLSPLFLSLWCIPALMELQQEDKVVSKYFSVFVRTVSQFKHCSWNALICIYTHTAANNDREILITLVCESTKGQNTARITFKKRDLMNITLQRTKDKITLYFQ